jgi:hypothetical protein
MSTLAGSLSAVLVFLAGARAKKAQRPESLERKEEEEKGGGQTSVKKNVV